jgi:hypothetical protein
LTSALGIAANVTVFALVRAVVVTGEPYRAPQELFQLLWSDHMAASPFVQVDLEALREITGILACLCPPTAVSEDFFSVFDVRPHLGRTLEVSDFCTGAREWDSALMIIRPRA